jgi:putative transposase
MRKTFKYRIYPTGKQERELNSRLESCRKLYNHFLGERKTLWENQGESTTLYTQINTLKELKVTYPNLTDVYCQALQNVAVRVDLAYKAFFRRIKSGDKKVGYPRFKSVGRYDSITYPLYGRGIKIKVDRTKVTGIGLIKTVFHRSIEGTPKTAIIKKSSTGKWYVSFSCEVENNILPISTLNIGIDVGLETFAYMSDDTKIESPRFFRKEENELAKSQRKLDKLSIKDKDNKVLNFNDKSRLKAKKVVSRVHERIYFKRHNFTHQESRKIVNTYQIICIEDLNVNRMLHNHCLAKSISDASWTSFFNLLHAKAEDAGRIVKSINPAYTSQDCSQCGHREKKSLSTRQHICKCCGLNINRDLNASLNILRIGLDSLGVNP